MCLIMAVGLFVLSVSVVTLADLGKAKYKTRNTARIVAMAGVSLQTGYFCATAGGSTVVQVCVCVREFHFSHIYLLHSASRFPSNLHYNGSIEHNGTNSCYFY
jgi:hypothetical protein